MSHVHTTLIIFLRQQDLMHNELVPRGQTTNYKLCLTILQHLKTAAWKK